MNKKIMGEVKVDGIEMSGLPAKVGAWPKVKAFLFQEIKVELTPAQQKFENDLNDFLHLEITWQDFHDFLFKEISFGKSK